MKFIYSYIILLILCLNPSAKSAETLFLYKGTFSRNIDIEELYKFKKTKSPSNKLSNLIKITNQKENKHFGVIGKWIETVNQKQKLKNHINSIFLQIGKKQSFKK